MRPGLDSPAHPLRPKASTEMTHLPPFARSAGRVTVRCPALPRPARARIWGRSAGEARRVGASLPWHFGAHTVPPGLRAQLSAIELPDAPEGRRYRPQAGKAAEETTGDSAAPLATQKLRIPTRDFRRSVAVGLGLLVAVVAALGVFRCSSAAREAPAVAGQATESPRLEVAATSEVAQQPTNVISQPRVVPSEKPTTHAPSAGASSGSPSSAGPSNAGRKPAAVNLDKAKPPITHAQPASGLPDAPPPSTSAPAQSGDTKSFRVGPR